MTRRTRLTLDELVGAIRSIDLPDAQVNRQRFVVERDDSGLAVVLRLGGEKLPEDLTAQQLSELGIVPGVKYVIVTIEPADVRKGLRGGPELAEFLACAERSLLIGQPRAEIEVLNEKRAFQNGPFRGYDGINRGVAPGFLGRNLVDELRHPVVGTPEQAKPSLRSVPGWRVPRRDETVTVTDAAGAERKFRVVKAHPDGFGFVLREAGR